GQLVVGGVRRLDHAHPHLPGPDAARQAVVRLVSHHHRRLRESPPDQVLHRAPALHRHLPHASPDTTIQAGVSPHCHHPPSSESHHPPPPSMPPLPYRSAAPALPASRAPAALHLAPGHAPDAPGLPVRVCDRCSRSRCPCRTPHTAWMPLPCRCSSMIA